MITLVIGDVPFLQEQALTRLKQSWGECDVQTFFGPETRGRDILEACRTLSLLSTSSAAVVRHAEGLAKKAQEMLLKECEPLHLDDAVKLVLVADKVDKRMKFWQTLSRNAEILSAAAPPVKSVATWLKTEIQRRALQLDLEAFDHLLAVAHENFGQAVLLLDRVELYRKDTSTVTGSDVVNCRVGGETAQIFAWTDAVGAGQWKSAFTLLQRLWAHHEEPLALLALLVRHFRILFKARENESLWGRSGELARILSVPPFVVEKYCRQSKRYRRRQLWQIWNVLLETDRQLKSSPVPRQVSVENLLWKLRQLA